MLEKERKENIECELLVHQRIKFGKDVDSLLRGFRLKFRLYLSFVNIYIIILLV